MMIPYNAPFAILSFDAPLEFMTQGSSGLLFHFSVVIWGVKLCTFSMHVTFSMLHLKFDLGYYCLMMIVFGGVCVFIPSLTSIFP